MADNLQVTQGSGTNVATDDVGGVHYQRVKIEFGKEGKAITEGTPTVINVSTSGDSTLKANVASNKIRIISLNLICNAAVNIKFKSASTDITGLYCFDAKGGIVLPECVKGWMETAVNESFIINLSAAVVVGGTFNWVLEA